MSRPKAGIDQYELAAGLLDDETPDRQEMHRSARPENSSVFAAPGVGVEVLGRGSEGAVAERPDLAASDRDRPWGGRGVV